jgi:shikimate kinase
MSNIYLVGFMGTGKTETAKLLAKRLKRAFIDMDGLIEAKEKRPIPEIFKAKGEPYFRKIEKEVVADLAKKDGLVVACGGGVFVDPDNIRVLRSSGTVVCLTSSPEVILERTSRFTHRPLLNVDNPLEKIKELLAKRMPSYSQAHFIVDCDKFSVEDAAREVARCLNLK